jgi:uroporphyrinogen III methyltransferase/synthase
VIDVGKVSLRAQQKFTQEEINDLIVQKAREGKVVVRLKGGDPFVFGRGGEEALACVQAGIPFTIVPGVSSAVAVPAYAGIPITQRGIVSAFTVFAGHEDPTKAESKIDYAALAAAAKLGTLVLLMGLFNLPQIVALLLEHGVDGDTPTACIERGTTADQRVVTGTLDQIPALIAQADFKPPAITVIGEVVTLREQGLDWFASLAEASRP